MGVGIPNGAIGVSVAVLTYSFFCLTCSSLVVGLLLSYGEKWTYVTFICGFTALSTVASIAQQFHYAFAWEVIKQAQFNKAEKSLTSPGLGLGGSAQSVDVVLFDIQFYCYNVTALNVLFWSVALFCGAWGIRSSWLGEWRERLSPISKVFAILFPILIVGLGQAPPVIRHAVVIFIVTNITLLGSLAIGSVLLILILYKYITTRRLIVGEGRRGGWWASEGSKERSRNRERDIGAEETTGSGVTTETLRSIYDRALVTRFTIGFVILAIFEVVIIIFNIFQPRTTKSIALSGKPNHSLSATISDILFFIPGVTASLIVFLVFGTTKSWRQYRNLVFGGCGVRTKIYERRTQHSSSLDSSNYGGLEFERLPSLPNRSEYHSHSIERRVKMFNISLPLELQQHKTNVEVAVTPADSSVSQSRARSGSTNLAFHKPRPIGMVQPIPLGRLPNLDSALYPPFDISWPVNQDPVIQYGPVEDERRLTESHQGISRGGAETRPRENFESDDDVSNSPRRNTVWPGVQEWEA